MDVNRFNQAVKEYELASGGAKLALSQMQDRLAAGRCISEDDATLFQRFVETMHASYLDAVGEAKAVLSAEELPEEDSPLSVYVTAYASCSQKLLQEKISELSAVLEPFVNVRANGSHYAETLRPYQEKAQAALVALQNSSLTVSDLEGGAYSTEAEALFLECVRMCEKDADEELEQREMLLDRVHMLFPERRIYDGLISGRFTLNAGITIDISDLPALIESAAEPFSETETAETGLTDEQALERMLFGDASGEDEQPAPASAEEIAAQADVQPEIPAAVEEIAAQADVQPEIPAAVEEIAAQEEVQPETPAPVQTAVTAAVNSGWEALGITDPAAVSVHAEPQLKIEASEKSASTFKAKAFEGELKKGFGILFAVISTTAQFGILTPELLVTQMTDRWPADKVQDAAADGCRSGYDLGYLNSNRAPDGTIFYSLTARGKAIFHHEKSAKLFPEAKKCFRRDWKDYEGSGPAELLRVIYAHFTTWLLQKSYCRQFDILPVFGQYLFGQHLPKFFGSKRELLAICVISDTPDGFRELLSVLDRGRADQWSFLIIGISRAHAAAVAQWFRTSIPELHDRTDIFYMDDSDGTVYTLSGEPVPDLPMYFSAAPDDPDTPDTPDDPDQLGSSDDPEPPEESGQPDIPDEPESLTEPETEPASDVSAPEEHTAETEEAVQEPAGEPERSDEALPEQPDEIQSELPEDEQPEDELPEEELPEEEQPDDEQPEDEQPEEEQPAKQALQIAELPEPEAAEELTEKERDQYHQLIMQMLASGKPYCASAYTRVLARRYPEMGDLYKQIAYAFDDPLAGCRYSSDMIFTVFFTQSAPISDHLMIAAVLRNYFYDQNPYDYTIPQLWDTISSNSLLTQNPALQDIIYRLQEFKSQNHHGVDYCADYRQQERLRMEETLAGIVSEAKRLYESNIESYATESVHQKRFLETKRIVFAPHSDLAVCLDYVRRDDRESLELIEEYLLEHIIRDRYVTEEYNIVPEEYNIDPVKIDAIIQQAWSEAGRIIRLERRSSDLMGKLYNNLYKGVEKIVQILCRYVVTLKGCAASEVFAEQAAYQQIRKLLLTQIGAATEVYEKNAPTELAELCGRQIICDTLAELRMRLEGSYLEASHSYYYIDFLKGEWVLLDDSAMPVLDEVYEIPELSIAARIERHFSVPETEFSDRTRAILEGGDDYGSARLILQYLHLTAPELPPPASEEQISEAAQYARADIENRRKGFMEDLELRSAYGQIDNTKVDMKESFVQIMDHWYQKALADENYGFFYKILEGIIAHIKKNACSRSVGLEQDVSAYIAEHPGAEQDETIGRAISQIRKRIAAQNYAAAEDLLNRLQKNDLDTPGSVLGTDYLVDFLNNYQMYTSRAGLTGTRFQSVHVHNKDTKGGNLLLESWPPNTGMYSDRVRRLLTTMGFNVGSVVPQDPIRNNSSFLVTIAQPPDGRKHTYTHPIVAFGSEAEKDGFRTVIVYGRMDANRLIDLMEQIGPAFNTMIIVDYSLTLADRRTLARMTKSLHLDKCFIVVDRLVAAYLAWNYTENTVNRMLMALTIPFSSYQPYVYDSATPIPPELFMGRQKELEAIMSSNGVHILYGGRQLGKSALLRMAQVITDHNEHHHRALWVDIKGRDYREAARRVSWELVDKHILDEGSETEDWGELSDLLIRRLHDKSPGREIPYLLLLLDEADKFIDSCEAVGYSPVDRLKDISISCEKQFKFVIAGLRNIIRFKNSALRDNVVLTHLSSLTVMPFRAAEARALLEVPLSYLGFRFPDDEKTETLISTIFGTTNYFPGLLQLYCAKLIESLQNNYAGYDESETPPYVLKEEQIKKALADSTLEKQIREKFDITLRLGDDDYYYLIALLAAYYYHENTGQNGVGAKEIKELAEEFEIANLTALSTDAIAALMEEMRELNVFQKTAGSRYRFSRLSFCQMMGSKQQIDDEILRCMENGG